jgi:hypothetical protein
MEIKDEFIEHLNHGRADAALEGVMSHLITRGYLLEGHTVDDGDPRIFHDPAGDPIANDMETAISDLVADLMHLVARERLDWAAILTRAATNHTEEQTEP